MHARFARSSLVRPLWWLALSSFALALPAAAEPAEALPTALWQLLKQAFGEPVRTVEPVWQPGSVSLSHSDRTLSVSWSGNLQVGAAGAVEVPLVAAGGAVTSVTWGGKAAEWSVRGGMVVLRLSADDSRRDSVQIQAQWPLDPRTGGAVVVPLPPWPRGQVSNDAGELEVLGADDDTAAAGTRALLVRSQQSQAPRVRKATYKVAVGAGAAVVELRVDIEARGQRGTVKLAPRSLALMDLSVDGKPVAPAANDDGEDGEDHLVEISGKGMRIVVARLQVKVEGDGEDQELDIGRVPSPITEVEVRLPGKRGVRLDPEVPVQTQVLGGQSVAHAWLPPGESLHLTFAAVEGGAVERTVRFSAETWQVLTLGEGLVRGKATIDLQIVQGKATSLLVQVPTDAVVANVEGGDITTWDVLAASGDQPRRLKVGFADDKSGGTGATARQIKVSFELPTDKTAGGQLQAPVLRPLGAFRENGAVALLDGDKMGFAPIEGAAGWLRAGLEALPAGVRKDLDGRADQVWRHIGAPPALPTTLAAARVRQVRLEARSTALVRVDERALRDSHVVVVDIKAGRTDKIVLDLPEKVGEPRVVAPSLSRVTAHEGGKPDAGRKWWELRFSSALEGSVQLQIDLEMLIAKDAKTLNLPDIRVQGAELETDTVALSAEPGLELVPSAKGETRVLPTTELPEAVARQAGRDLVAGFRSLRGPIQVELNVLRRATVATLDAFAKSVWVDSHLLPDGRIASKAVVLLQSAGRPVLRIGLPKGAEVLALTVDGNNVKAVRDEKGELAVPLGGGALLRVEVRYEVRGSELGMLARATVVAPRFDVRQGPLYWRLRVPGDRHQYGVTTDLRKDEGYGHAEAPPPPKDDLVPLPLPFEARDLFFSAAVRDAGGEASVALWLGFQPPVSVGWLLVAGGIGLAVLLWRRGKRGYKPFGPGGAALLVGVGILWMGDRIGDLLDLASVVGVIAVAVVVAVKGARWLTSRKPATRSVVVDNPPPAPPPPPPAPPKPAAAADDDQGGES